MCHCAWCQKRTGTAFGTEAVFQDAAVRFTKGAPKIYRPFSGVVLWGQSRYFLCGSRRRL